MLWYFAPAGVLLVFFGAILGVYPLSSDGDDVRAMLQVTAGALITVFALALTILLVGAQLFARYSYRLVGSRVFFPGTFAYFIGFIIIVIYTLALVAGFHFETTANAPIEIQAKISFGLAGLLLASLVPFFYFIFKYRLDPARVIEGQQTEAKKPSHKPDTAKDDDLPEGANNIFLIASSAYALRDYDTVNKAMQALADVARTAYEGGRFSQGKKVFEKMRDFAVMVVDDFGLIRTIMDILEQTGKQVVRTKAPIPRKDADEPAGALVNVGLRALPTDEDVSSWVANALGNLGSENPSHQGDARASIVEFLKTLRKEAVKTGRERTRRLCEGSLVRVWPTAS